ncbi:glycosyltransferase family 2 protein [Vibrio cyclitrophicus]|uniref:glycosyltransferase family 2 protein n=2 Tax=Vibrio cyclitrophicus TaxID=47951 RepID=UPI0002D583F7|nr:glycosyltransferase family A protein [Vibrio cyclitrophicus]OED89922.1 hypothetical protein OAQ_18255 [Vibrio cyclitrophicus ZF30]PMF56458.1 hypothetical protein BCV12_01490 [Vibrio cyclitrophicus]PMP56342.1 hypothetical protein BCS84_09850 [Vibrio cyclitrophicus]
MNISVIIPTKNRCEFLKRALASVLVQIRENDEIIIVDDASDTPQYDFIDDSRVKVIYNQISQGGAKSRNIGVDESRNEILMFLDDDDAWVEHKISSQLEILKSKSVSMVFSGKLVVWDTDLQKVVRKINTNKSKIDTSGLCKCNYVGSTSSVAVRRSDFLSVGGFDSKLECFQDYDLWLRLSRKGYGISDQQHNVYYTIFRRSGMQISRATDGRHERAAKYLLNKYENTFNTLDGKMFSANLNQLVSKATNHSNPIVSLRYSTKALVTAPSVRGFKFFIASIASMVGIKNG